MLGSFSLPVSAETRLRMSGSCQPLVKVQNTVLCMT